jgi:DME family drug/metabolite transporter
VNQERSGSAAAAAAAFLFGTSYVATAFLLRSFTPAAGAFWRAALAAVFLYALVGFSLARDRRPAAVLRRAREQPGQPPIAGRVVRAAVVGLLGGPLFLVGMNVAVDGVGATITSFVAGLYAVLAAVLAPFVLSERLERTALVGFGLALLGTALLAELDIAEVSSRGFLAGLGAALSYSFYLVLGRRWSRPYGLRPEVLTLSTVTATIAVLAVWLAVAAPETVWPDDLRRDALVALLWLAATLAAGQTLVVMSVRRIDARRSAAFLLLNPLTATVLAAILLDEGLTRYEVAGALLVLAGMALAPRSRVPPWLSWRRAARLTRGAAPE